MLIILEGPDGAGKSTLAKRLHLHPSLPNCHLIHRGPPTTNHLLDEYLQPLAYYDPRRDHVVCDRWHLGELVYPNLPESARVSLATGTGLAYLELFLMSRGALLVHVDAPTEEIYRRRTARREEVVASAAIDRERDRFSHAVKSSWVETYPTSVFDERALDDVHVPAILRAARSVQLAVESAAGYPNYVGPPLPDLLLLGDVRGTRYPHYRTAFAPLGGSSGEYLWSALVHSLPSCAGVGVANANELDAHCLWEDLGRPPVVALGRHAREGAIWSGFEPGEFGVVPHPQFVRRFHYRRSDDYAALIYRVSETKEDCSSWPR